MKYDLQSHGPVLATRPTGRALREEIERGLRSDPVAELDFEHVVAISPSCADELVGRLFADLANGDLAESKILLLNLGEDHREILEPVLRRRGLIAPEITDDGVHLLNAADHLAETYKLATSLGQFRTSDVATREGLTVPAANNRLARLLKSHLVRRVEKNAPHGGKEYLYSAS